MQRRLATGAVVITAENLAVDRDETPTLLGKCRHKPLKGGTELLGINQPEQPAERIMAGDMARGRCSSA
jgi:hypothetical protein